MSYVYWIHLPNEVDIGQGYVGVCKSNDINVRWNRHKLEVANPLGSDYTVYRALRKYGVDNVVWEILFEGPYEGCLQLEEYWRPNMHMGWNIHSGGRSCSPMQGKNHSIESKLKMSNATKGRKRSTESRIKQSNTQKGHTLSDSTKEKIRLAQSGKANKGVLKRRKEVIASSGEVFESVSAAARWLNINPSNIFKQISNVYNTAGIHPVTGEKLTWRYQHG